MPRYQTALFGILQYVQIKSLLHHFLPVSIPRRRVLSKNSHKKSRSVYPSGIFMRDHRDVVWVTGIEPAIFFYKTALLKQKIFYVLYFVLYFSKSHSNFGRNSGIGCKLLSPVFALAKPKIKNHSIERFLL